MKWLDLLRHMDPDAWTGFIDYMTYRRDYLLGKLATESDVDKIRGLQGGLREQRAIIEDVVKECKPNEPIRQEIARRFGHGGTGQR